MLGQPLSHYHYTKDLSACSGVIAWGRKPSATFAEKFAHKHNLNLVRLEDGFLRSLALGSEEPPLSIVMDDLGIYYDAHNSSRLESLIKEPLSDTQHHRAQTIIKNWQQARISKYNYSREYQKSLPKKYVLVADQVVGDVSINYGMANADSFQNMLQSALEENPDCSIVLKIHPSTISDQKNGHFDLDELSSNSRILIISEDVHPVSLIEHAQAIYTVTSQIGFEGLIWGKKVRTFGMPFYAGWGLSKDELTNTRRHPTTLENLVYAALVAYPRYLDPETGSACDIEQLIEWFALQRRMRERFPINVYASGFSYYKKPIVRRFFQGSHVHFDCTPEKIPKNATHIMWRRNLSKLHQKHKTLNNIVQLEDGFIRSVGLGADLIQPISWALDSKGIYYDASSPSDLEHTLQFGYFDEKLLNRAIRLRQQLVSENITKYNIGHNNSWQRSKLSHSNQAKTIILVPGQVEGDASLIHGSPSITNNIELLKAVRNNNPDAYIIYKTHPDVIAGLRRHGHNEIKIEQWCDEVIGNAIIADLLLQIDEVHTMTSLTGFEALLREKKVICYGLPFYSGWGLTQDMLTLDRRSRKLTLDELVAASLILYPTYVSRTTGRFTTPERALEELVLWRKKTKKELTLWRQGIRWGLKLERWINENFGNR